jgi:PAS domain S-box-containing protein
MVTQLIQNIALLVALAYGLQLLSHRLEGHGTRYRVAAGLLFGLVGIVGMLTPVTFAPGVIYDGRSLVLAIAGIFGGPLPAAIATVMCAAFRYYLGGDGAWVGMAVCIEAAVLGVVLHRLRRRDPRWTSAPALLAFGMAVHAIMLGLQLFIPGGVGWDVAARFGLIIIVLYPLAFLLAAHMFLEGERRRKNEASLRASEEQFRLVANLLPVGIIIFDQHDRVRYVSPRFQQIFGYMTADLPSVEAWWSLAYPDTKMRAQVRNRWEAGIKLARETGRERAPVEHPVACRDGTVKQIEFRSAFSEALNVVVFSDVTERRRAEERLHASESFQAAMVACSPFALYSIDADGVVLSWNASAERLLGWRADEVVGRPLPVVPEEYAQDFLAMRKLNLEGHAFSGREVECLRKDGSRFTGRLSVAPMRGPAETIIGIVAALEDITGSKALEHQLFQSQKMEAVGQLAGGIAHDFNNILQVIRGYSELALDEIAPEAEAHFNLLEVQSAAAHAQTLVSQLLAFSRRQVLEMRDIDLNEAVRDIRKMLSRLMGADITLDVRLGADLPCVRADAGQLGQILTNLVINARDAMPGGGVITIGTDRQHVDRKTCEGNPWARPGEYVRVTVSDTGCGMDEDTVRHAFEPFFTTKEVGEGTGLGLSTVFGLAVQHQGFVDLSSAPGCGTTVSVYLPLSTELREHSDSPVQASAPRGDETILFAEDDPAVRSLTRAILERAGYTVITARDGEEALRLHLQHREEIALALLDVVMPGMGGRGVYEALRDLDPELPVLFASGYSIENAYTNFIAEAGLELIQKPFLTEELLGHVRRALDHVPGQTTNPDLN